MFTVKMSSVSLLVVALVSCLAAVDATRSTGACPTNYQTSFEFSEKFIKGMSANANGYIVVASNARQERCQRIKFNIDSGTYNYTIVTAANVTVHSTSTYAAKPRTAYQPGQVTLGMDIDLFPSPFRSVHLFPVYVSSEFIAFMSCWNVLLGISKDEQLVVMTPFPYSGSPTLEEIRTTLNDSLIIPHLMDDLKPISQNCTAVRDAPVPEPPGIVNFFNSIASNSIFNPTTYQNLGQNALDAFTSVTGLQPFAPVLPTGLVPAALDPSPASLAYPLPPASTINSSPSVQPISSVVTRLTNVDQTAESAPSNSAEAGVSSNDDSSNTSNNNSNNSGEVTATASGAGSSGSNNDSSNDSNNSAEVTQSADSSVAANVIDSNDIPSGSAAAILLPSVIS